MSEVEEVPLGEEIEVISGVHVESDKVSNNSSKTPYLTGPDDFEELGFTVTKYTDDPSSFCEPGDTLVTVKGSGCGNSTFSSERAAISRQLKALRPKENLNPRYLYYWLQTKEELLSILSQGTSIPGLSTTDLTTLKIPLRPLSQQCHIADILSTVDEQIQQTDEMIEKTMELKRGLVQDLVTHGINHRSYREELLGPKTVEIPTSWSVERMVDVAEIVSGSTPKKSDRNYWGGDICWATPTDVTGTEGIYLSNTEEKITKAGLENCSANLLQPGAVLMTSRATIGEAVINTVPVTTNQGFKSLVPGEDLHSEYLYYFVHTMADYLTEIGGGSTFPEINKSDTENIRVPVPPLDEQKRIAEILTSAERKRLDEICHKNLLQELKRGLMQDLLTGSVRVDIDD
ncbi:restriction endonuclease subunit S [Salinarchaeum laminariae]|uniref:restriction endonuclease subunit S n=1 Tax=Salinarchaeum laminariae TaxID=869888 RepID=UPI0020C07389|nr:restriction endonuclease subunit S [Salinarchaeum laminariae]